MQKFNQLGNSSIELLDAQGFPMGTSSNTTGLNVSTNLNRRGALSRVGKLGVGALLPMTGGMLLPSSAKAQTAPIPGRLMRTLDGGVTYNFGAGTRTSIHYSFYNTTAVVAGKSRVTCSVYKNTRTEDTLTRAPMGTSQNQIYQVIYMALSNLQVWKKVDLGWEDMMTLRTDEIDHTKETGCRNNSRRLEVEAQDIKSLLRRIVSEGFSELVQSIEVNMPSTITGYAAELFYATFVLSRDITTNHRTYKQGMYHIFFNHQKNKLVTSFSTVAMRSFLVHTATASAAVVSATQKAIEEYSNYSSAVSSAWMLRTGMGAGAVGTTILAVGAFATEYTGPMAVAAIATAVGGVTAGGGFVNEVTKIDNSVRAFKSLMGVMGVAPVDQEDPMQCPA